VRELSRLLPRAIAKRKDVEAVHQARVTTRRLKAAVDLAEPVLPAHPHKDFTRALRRLRRALGPVRDVDVMLGHLKDLRGDARHGAAVRWLSACLEAQRAELSRSCCNKLSPRGRLAGLRAWETLREELRRGEPAIRKRAVRIVPVQLAAFHDHANAVSRYRAGGASQQQHGPGPDVHELRIAGKLLRYTLELGEPLGYQLSPSVLKSFKQLQEALGLWHDDVVLGERALSNALEQMLSHHQPQVYGRALELAQMLWKRSERHLTRFDRLWADHGERLSSDILRAFQSPPEEPVRTASPSRRTVRSATAATDAKTAKTPDEPAESDPAVDAAPDTPAAALTVSHDPVPHEKEESAA
jgi:CHAD domain-containing protein